MTLNSGDDKRSRSLRRKIARGVAKLLDEVRQSASRPKELDYFIDVLHDVYVSDDGLLRRFGESPPLIGIYCMMVPEELIYAAGFIPMRLCGGSYDAFMVGSDYTPRDTCPIVKASLGASRMGIPSVYALCDPVIIPATCDAKRKVAEELSLTTTVWVLDMPHIKDAEASRESWRRQIQGMAQLLNRLGKQRVTGRTITVSTMQDAMAMVAAASQEMRRLGSLRKGLHPPLSGIEASVALSAYGFDRADRWTEGMRGLNNELEARLANNPGPSREERKRPRLLLAGSPSIFPHWKVPLLAEEMGGDIVIDESCVGDRLLYDTLGLTEGTLDSMIEGIAARYLAPCICPVFTPNEDRLYRLVELVDEFAVDGVLYHVLKGCIPYDFEIYRVEEILRKRGIPLLRIESDYTPEDVEQLRTRIEAFIEMLSEKEKRGGD